MRRLDEHEIDPEIEACLDAIDATLAGEPVDPRFAEMAELALLLADDRPRPRDAFTGELDARVARRFAAAPGDGPAGGPAAARPGGATRPRWRPDWTVFGTAGALAALAGAIIAVVLVAGSGSPGGVSSSSSAA